MSKVGTVEYARLTVYARLMVYARLYHFRHLFQLPILLRTNFRAKATNLIANRTNSFANRTKSIAKTCNAQLNHRFYTCKCSYYFATPLCFSSCNSPQSVYSIVIYIPSFDLMLKQLNKASKMVAHVTGRSQFPSKKPAEQFC